ncbi:MAG: fumarylacetoacetate hydrolase family protein [Deltaproteobacteria bacterium]|nr:fumarylacetoacetate hydrolase family protein [Deltaproteobacteria bacterium]
MEIARFLHKERERFGVVKGDEIKVAEGDIFRGFKLTRQVCSLKEVKLLPPTHPSKIVALGLNYRDHAEEVGLKLPDEPLIFLKPSSAVIGHLDHIIYPPTSQRIDYEGELGIVIGKEAKGVSEKGAEEFILGYTCFNDVTARDLQKKDRQWTRGKGFDTFAPIGPWIETQIDPAGLRLETFLNGERKQSSNTSNLIFKPRQLVGFISQIMTLYPGDVIATGTPSGIGPMEVGDRVEVAIEGIGSLINFVKKG